MANTNSSLITTLDSTDGSNQFIEPQATGGRVRIASGFVEVTGTDFDADNDTVVLCRLPANAVIKELRIASDDQDTGTQSILNLGVYPAGGTTASAAIDEDCYGTAFTDFRAATDFTDYRHETLDINTIGQKIWQDAGVTSDPGPTLYDLVLTQTATVSSPQTAFTIAFKILYVID